MLVIIVHRWDDCSSLPGRRNRPALNPLVKQWRKGFPFFSFFLFVLFCSVPIDINYSGSVRRTLSWSLPEKRCHTACVKGNNYLLELLQGLEKFRVIIQSLEVINTGAHTHLKCERSVQQNITGEDIYLRKLLSLSVQGHLNSHCRLGFVIIF